MRIGSPISATTHTDWSVSARRSMLSREACPDLVDCSISGFGQTGRMRSTKGVDLVTGMLGPDALENGRAPEGAAAVTGAFLPIMVHGADRFLDVDTWFEVGQRPPENLRSAQRTSIVGE